MEVYRCPHIRRDERGFYCAHGINAGAGVDEIRRTICDQHSLQLWCLDGENYRKCIEFISGDLVKSSRAEKAG